MQISRKLFALFALVSLLILSSGFMAFSPAAFARYYTTQTRVTSTTIGVKPTVIGLGQELTVNLFIWPPPSPPDFYARTTAVQGMYFENVTVTFTRPDGSKDTFMPINPSLKATDRPFPGRTESTGGTYFYYKPNQVGNWSVSFSYPEQQIRITNDPELGNLSVTYTGGTSSTIRFTVQEDPVNAGLIDGWPWSPLPTNYWTYPISPNNREWSQISAPWKQVGYDSSGTKFNPYSTAPDTAHIVWKAEYGRGNGIVGGDWGSTGYVGQTAVPIIIMQGRAFYNDVSGGTFSCRDLRTGELIYRVTGSITVAQNLMLQAEYAPNVPRVHTGSAESMLWGVTSSSWRRYDPATGALLQTITNVPAGLGNQLFADGDPVVYVRRTGGWNTTRYMGYAFAELIKWDYQKVTGNNWMTGIVWNVSIIQPDGTSVGDNERNIVIYRFDGAGVVIAISGALESHFMAFDMETGKYLYTKDTGYLVSNRRWCVSPSGPFALPDIGTMTMSAFDVKTGNKVWTSESFKTSEWVGAIRGGGSLAYSTIYVGSYDNHVVAIDANNGKLKFASERIGDPTGEVVWPGSTWCENPVIADGKVYWSNNNPREQRPTPRFTEMICQDAYTGKTLWRLSGSYDEPSIAEGYMVVSNQFDGRVYTFGKGQTSTAVSAPDVAVPKGTPVLIHGTVMDMSPAQPNTPAVAKESMSEWMDYLHMQNATLINNPPSPKGVPVLLMAVDPNGNIQNIGTVTSDSMGYFKTSWTPPVTGIYTILASFAGDDSYWSSSAQTGLLVTEASATVEPQQPAAQADNTGVIVGTGIAVIIAVAVGVVLLLRKKP